MEKKIFTIKSIDSGCGPVKTFVLSPDDGKNITFKPGQFAMLFQLENGDFAKLSRPYSIASSPLENELRFIIKITGGQFTSILDSMKPGDKLGVQGPFGNFAYNDEKDAICIAAGTGVAPMFGIIQHLILSKSDARLTLFYSNKRQESLACKGMLDKFQQENPKIKIVYTLTQEQPAGWQHELGRFNEEIIRKHANYAKDAAVFICGPMEFAKTMKEIMLRLGAEEKKMKVEAWG